MCWEIFNIIITRECNLPVNALKSFICEEIGSILVEVDKLSKYRLQTAQNLIKLLHKAISIADDSSRGVLIGIKRNIFNNKIPNIEAIALLRDSKNVKLKRVFSEWESIFLKEKTLQLRLQGVYDSYLKDVREEIVQLCSNVNFQKGIQLSGQRFLKKLNQYIEAVTANVQVNKPLRQTEDGLISFLYRMALKPSPFATFTNINLHLSEVYKEIITHNSNELCSFCSPSRLLMQWLAYQCQKLPILREELALRINPTLSRVREFIIFFTRPDDGTTDMFGKEKFVKIKDSSMIQKIETLLSNAILNKKYLISNLINNNPTESNRISEYIEKLISIGLIQRYFNIPDQTVRYSNAISERLLTFKNKTTKKLALSFKKIHQIELKFQTASVAQREVLIEDFQNEFLRIVSMIGSVNPGLNEARSFFYEDVGKIYYNQKETKEKISICKADLVYLCKLLPLLDDSVIERVSIYKFFKNVYPQRKTAVNLLNFYQDFASFDVEKITNIMTGKHYEEVAEIRKMRIKWYQALHNLIEKERKKEILELDKKWLNNFIETIPEFVGEWESTAFYLQECERLNNQQQFVLNSVSMGYGAMMSRFTMIFQNEQKMLTNAFSNELNQFDKSKDIVDLTSVLGINTNLHPPFLKQVIEYPGCIADQRNLNHVYNLNDLYVIADDLAKRLKLICKYTGKEIYFRPLNLLFPTVGPSLYRFLYLFAPYCNFKGGFWKGYLSQYLPNENIILPRLKLGKIIINRKTWLFESKKLPKFNKNNSDPLRLLIEIEKWRNSENLPLYGFYHQLSEKNQFEDWVSAVKNTIRISNKIKLRKPHFLDFRSPFLIRIFNKHLNEMKADQFVFQECLPSFDYYLQSSSNCKAQEFLIQVDKADRL